MGIALAAVVSLAAGCIALAFYMDWLGLWVSEQELREKREAAAGRMRLLQPEAPPPGSPAIPGPGDGAPPPGRAFAFDVDAASLSSLREALPAWELEAVNGATAASLPRDWGPGVAGLLVVGLRANVAESMGLCRFLAHRNSYACDPWQETVEPGEPPGGGGGGGRAGALLVVLTPSGQEWLTEEALGAGTHRCLSLPLQAGQVTHLLSRPRADGDRGRRSPSPAGARAEDPWRDDGGEG
jgi:hypothetical protein